DATILNFLQGKKLDPYLSGDLLRYQPPRAAIFAAEQLSRLGPALRQMLIRHVPHQALLAAVGEVPEQARGRRAVPDFDVARGTLARLQAIQEVPHVIEVRVVSVLHLHRGGLLDLLLAVFPLLREHLEARAVHRSEE